MAHIPFAFLYSRLYFRNTQNPFLPIPTSIASPFSRGKKQSEGSGGLFELRNGCRSSYLYYIGAFYLRCYLTQSRPPTTLCILWSDPNPAMLRTLSCPKGFKIANSTSPKSNTPATRSFFMFFSNTWPFIPGRIHDLLHLSPLPTLKSRYTMKLEPRVDEGLRG